MILAAEKGKMNIQRWWKYLQIISCKKVEGVCQFLISLNTTYGTEITTQLSFDTVTK